MQKKKIILFARVSTSLQDLEQHKQILTQYALSLGYRQKDLIFVGKNESGYSLKEEERLSLQQLYDTIDTTPEVNAVVVYEISRLARKPEIAFSVRSKLQEKHVQLYILNPSCKCFNENDWSISEGSNLIFGLFATLAENERNLLIERTTRGKNKKIKEGFWVSGPVPYGYTLDSSKKLIINEEEAEVVRLIFDLRNIQHLSVKQIRDELNSRGHNLVYGKIRSILVNENYTGRFTKREGSKNAKTLPPIITDEQWELSKTVAKELMSRRDGKHSRKFIGRKLLRCVECGNLMGTHLLVDGLYYFCLTHRRGDIQSVQCSSAVNIKCAHVDRLIWDVVRKHYSLKMILQRDATIKTLKEELPILEQKILATDKEFEKLDLRTSRAKKLYLMGELTDEEFERNTEDVRGLKKDVALKKSQLELRIEQIRGQIQNLEKQGELGSDEIKKILDDTESINDIDKKNEICREVLEKITIGTIEGTKHRELIFYFLDTTVQKFEIEYRTYKIYQTGLSGGDFNWSGKEEYKF